MVKTHNKRCPHCGFLTAIKWGKRAGRTRYFCNNCKSYFTDRRIYISDHNKLPWFREWVVGKRSIAQISHASGYSVRHLKTYFSKQLPKCPVWHIQRREKVNLLIDGTYFPNKVCLVLYRDSNIKMTVFYRVTDGERFDELREDLRNILATGIQIQSVTCDGAPNILKAVRDMCPNAIIQRCTVHIALEIETWLTKKPQTPAARELLELVRLLAPVRTHEQAKLT